MKNLKNKTMNIYALPGHKVKVTAETIQNGTDWDREQALKYLTVEQVYTVDFTLVSNYHTDVFLKEFPDNLDLQNARLNRISFDSCQFVDALYQSEESNMKHPDYPKYHR